MGTTAEATTAAKPEKVVPTPGISSTNLSVTAPVGARFDIETVSTKGGTEKFQAPILVWENTEAMVAHYSEQGILDMADGTSLRVAFQAAARRGYTKNKSFDEIAQSQIAYKPGKRSGATSTPSNVTARKAKEAIEKNPEAASEVQKLLEGIASGKFTLADLQSLNS